MIIIASSTREWINNVNSRVSRTFKKLAFTCLTNPFEIKCLFLNEFLLKHVNCITK